MLVNIGKIGNIPENIISKRTQKKTENMNKTISVKDTESVKNQLTKTNLKINI